MAEKDEPEKKVAGWPDTWQAALVKALNDKLPDAGKCVRCGDISVTIADEMVTPVRWKDGGVTIGGSSYPQAMIVCRNCGHTSYFNLMVLGVLPQEKKGGDKDG